RAPACASPLALHDALPILATAQLRLADDADDLLAVDGGLALADARHPEQSGGVRGPAHGDGGQGLVVGHDVGGHAICPRPLPAPDRKSTRLNSSHVKISYA